MRELCTVKYNYGWKFEFLAANCQFYREHCTGLMILMKDWQLIVNSLWSV